MMQGRQCFTGFSAGMTTVQDRSMKDIIAQHTARNILKEFITKCGTQIRTVA